MKTPLCTNLYTNHKGYFDTVQFIVLITKILCTYVYTNGKITYDTITGVNNVKSVLCAYTGPL